MTENDTIGQRHLASTMRRAGPSLSTMFPSILGACRQSRDLDTRLTKADKLHKLLRRAIRDGLWLGDRNTLLCELDVLHELEAMD